MANRFQLLLIASVLMTAVFTLGCKQENKLWNKVKKEMTRDKLTTSTIKTRLSEEAIDDLLNEHTDTLKRVQGFFNAIKDDDYRADVSGETTILFFTPDKDVHSGGPMVVIEGKGEDWVINDIQLGR